MEKLPCKTTFDMTVAIVIKAVKEKLAHGGITEQSLDDIQAALTTSNHQVEAFCHSTYEKCMTKSKLDLMVPPRTNVFGRIMVQPLEKLFDRKQRRFSEKQLSNYFHVLKTVLGREQYEAYHDNLSRLLREEIRDHGSNFTWNEFYHHPECTTARRTTLMRIAKAFDHFEHRMIWFLNVMEGAGFAPEETAGTMQFTEKQAYAFLKSLFDEFIHPHGEDKDTLYDGFTDQEKSAITRFITILLQHS